MEENQAVKEREQRPKKEKRTTIRISGGAIKAVVALALAAAGIFGVTKMVNREAKTTKIGFEDIGELVTQSAYCTEVAVTEGSRELFGITIPFTQSKYIYSYDVEIKAGFNFKEIEWAVDEKEKAITVRLPEVEILSRDLDTESFELYLEDESIFRHITLTENNDTLTLLEEQAEADAIANGLLENARTNAETILTGFFANVYDMKEYTITFSELK